MATLIMKDAIRADLTPAERDLWRQEIERRCGIWFADSRLFVLRSALSQRMRRLGIPTYRDYYHAAVPEAAEWDALQEAILNRETSFFRHGPSFAVLALELLPRLAEARRKRGGDALVLWSAGCSTGEEAYSLAMAADEVLGAGFEPHRVVGSDLSGYALAAARNARYHARAVVNVPERLRARYLVQDGGGYAVRAPFKDAVRFERFNFIDPATYPAAGLDVIFCQNVLIYFREAVRVKVADALAASLRPGGYLVPAPGELAGVRVAGLKPERSEQAVVLRKM